MTLLSLIGNISVWLTVAVLFPLLFLPASILAAHTMRLGATAASLIWLVKVLTSVGLGILFLRLIPAPLLSGLPGSFFMWLAMMVALAGAMALSGGPARWAGGLLTITDPLTRLIGRSAMWLTLVMAIVQFTVVILRYVFGVSFIWVQESITYFHGTVFLLAAGYALLTDDHVRVDIFYRGASDRMKAWINLYGTYFLLFPVCLILLWAAAPYVFASWAATEGSNESSGVQLLFVLKSLIPAFAVFLLLAGFSLAMRCVQTLIAAPSSPKENGADTLADLSLNGGRS
ncbi:MAG: TRAP transporter small permease subunit [Pseudomonadota bacterium]